VSAPAAAAPAHGEVRSEVRGRVLAITVDRAAKRNAFTPKMMGELADALTRLDEDSALWVGVLGFAGDHTTAGLDLPLFFGPGAAGAGEGARDRVDPFGLARRCRKPVVTALQGITFTVGIELALAADIAVAAEDARFSQMEARRGIAPFGGATFRFLQRMGWGNAMYHLLRCDEFDAREALRCGIVQEVVPVGRALERAHELAAEIAANAPLGVQATKAAALEYVQQGEAAAVARIPKLRESLVATADFREGLASFVERRAARFEGR
jgi:enoyl-CoA hydratase/carnithine racemase